MCVRVIVDFESVGNAIGYSCCRATSIDIKIFSSALALQFFTQAPSFEFTFLRHGHDIKSKYYLLLMISNNTVVLFK